MASFDPQGDIVPIELPNPEEAPIWEGENNNIYLCSFCLLLPPLFHEQGLDAMVTV